VDLVLDTIGGETIQRSLEIIRPFGRLISIVDIAIPQSLGMGQESDDSFCFSPQYRKIRRFDKTHRASSASPSD